MQTNTKTQENISTLDLENGSVVLVRWTEKQEYEKFPYPFFCDKCFWEG